MPVKHLMRNKLSWLAVGLAVLTLAVLAACAKNPVTGEDELVLMSESQELAMGAKYYPQTTQLNHGLPANDPNVQSYVSKLGHRLAASSHRPGIPWEFNVVNSSMVNAFALPGGKISITRGMIVRMNNEDELASVLGHEIGHVTARHSVQRYTQGMLISIAVLGLAVALGDSDWAPLGVAAAGVAGKLLMLSYSRDNERQADQLGFIYMTQNNYNPRAMTDMFGILRSLQKSEPGFVEAMLSSHPLTSERIAAARRRALEADPRLYNQPYQVKAFNRAVALQKKRAPAYAAMDKGNAYVSAQRYDNAISMYHRAISLYPAEGQFHSRLALVYLKQRQNKRALMQAKQGMKYSDKTYSSLVVAGFAFRRTGQWKNAAQAHYLAAKQMPEQYVNLFYLAYALDRWGQHSHAVNIYRKVYQLSPKSKYGRAAKGRLKKLGYKY